MFYCISLLQVLQLCKYILLYTCSPAALVRLAETSLSKDFSHFCYMYEKQHHSSISDFLKYHIESCWNAQSVDGLMMQVIYTHAYHIFSRKYCGILFHAALRCSVYSLVAFSLCITILTALLLLCTSTHIQLESHILTSFCSWQTASATSLTSIVSCGIYSRAPCIQLKHCIALVKGHIYSKAVFYWRVVSI